MIKGTIFPVFWTFSILLKLFGSMVLWTWRTTLPELRQQSCTVVWQGGTCLLNFDGLGNGTLNKRFGSAWFFIFLWAFVTCVLFFSIAIGTKEIRVIKLNITITDFGVIGLHLELIWGWINHIMELSSLPTWAAGLHPPSHWLSYWLLYYYLSIATYLLIQVATTC